MSFHLGYLSTATYHYHHLERFKMYNIKLCFLFNIGHPQSPSAVQRSISVTSPTSDADLDAVHDPSSTCGVAVHHCSAADVSVWDFSGADRFHPLYDHFVGNVNCLHAVVFSLADAPAEQKRQVSAWLTFFRGRIPPVEPLGDRGRSRRPARVLLCATHADAARCANSSAVSACQRSATTGEFKSDAAEATLRAALADFGHVFDIHSKVRHLIVVLASSVIIIHSPQILQKIPHIFFTILC